MNVVAYSTAKAIDLPTREPHSIIPAKMTDLFTDEAVNRMIGGFIHKLCCKLFENAECINCLAPSHLVY
jgi:hypothetical protein